VEATVREIKQTNLLVMQLKSDTSTKKIV